MANIRGIFNTNPATGVPGLWVELNNGQIVGISDEEINSTKPNGANPSQNTINNFLAACQTKLDNQIPGLGVKISIHNIKNTIIADDTPPYNWSIQVE